MKLNKMIDTKKGRLEAIAKNDAEKYVLLCLKEDISKKNCEMPNLFDKGLAIIIKKEDQEKNILQEEYEGKKANKYSSFYAKARRLSTDIGKESNTKYKLIMGMYPKRFGPGGKQDLRKYSDAQIGVIFNKIADYCKRKQNR